VELVVLFVLTSISSFVLYLFSKFFSETKLNLWILIPGIFCLFSLWVGLFLDIPELPNGEWWAVGITFLFLHGLSSFFLLLLRILRERFLLFPLLPLRDYTLEPFFLNISCLFAIVFHKIFLLFFQSNISISAFFSLTMIFPFYTFFYYKKYQKLEYINQSNLLRIYLLFSILFILYFVVGLMCLFILTPFNIPDLK
jgi:hypothetical protein